MLVVMKNVVNSRKLYMELARYNLNVTDLDTEVYVYGDACNIDDILNICKKWGDIIEQEEEKKA